MSRKRSHGAIPRKMFRCYDSLQVRTEGARHDTTIDDGGVRNIQKRPTHFFGLLSGDCYNDFYLPRFQFCRAPTNPDKSRSQNADLRCVSYLVSFISRPFHDRTSFVGIDNTSGFSMLESLL